MEARNESRAPSYTVFLQRILKTLNHLNLMANNILLFHILKIKIPILDSLHIQKKSLKYSLEGPIRMSRCLISGTKQSRRIWWNIFCSFVSGSRRERHRSQQRPFPERFLPPGKNKAKKFVRLSLSLLSVDQWRKPCFYHGFSA